MDSELDSHLRQRLVKSVWQVLPADAIERVREMWLATPEMAWVSHLPPDAQIECVRELVHTGFFGTTHEQVVCFAAWKGTAEGYEMGYDASQFEFFSDEELFSL